MNERQSSVWVGYVILFLLLVLASLVGFLLGRATR